MSDYAQPVSNQSSPLRTHQNLLKEDFKIQLKSSQNPNENKEVMYNDHFEVAIPV